MPAARPGPARARPGAGGSGSGTRAVPRAGGARCRRGCLRGRASGAARSRRWARGRAPADLVAVRVLCLGRAELDVGGLAFGVDLPGPNLPGVGRVARGDRPLVRPVEPDLELGKPVVARGLREDGADELLDVLAVRGALRPVPGEFQGETRVLEVKVPFDGLVEELRLRGRLPPGPCLE